MLYTIMHGKIHRATVTEANLEYMGSVTYGLRADDGRRSAPLRAEGCNG